MLTRSVVGALTLLLCSQLAAQCLQPQRPPPVDVKSQDAELLQVTYRAAQQFLFDADEFLRCIENSERQLTENGASDDNKAARRRLFHATVDDIRAVNANLQKQSESYRQLHGKALEAAFEAPPRATTNTGNVAEGQEHAAGYTAEAAPSGNAGKPAATPAKATVAPIAAEPNQ